MAGTWTDTENLEESLGRSGKERLLPYGDDHSDSSSTVIPPTSWCFHQNRINIALALWSLACTIFSVTALISWFPHGVTNNGFVFPQVPTITRHCGNSTEEARGLGCKFDFLEYAWIPPECFDQTIATEFEEWVNDKDRLFVVVVAVGRRTENLEALVQQYGTAKVQAVTFDITQLVEMPAFTADIMKNHPDVDCIVLNSGIKRKMDFSDPSSIEVEVLSLEFKTDCIAQLSLTKAFLPFLPERESESAFIYVTFALGLIPIPQCSNYCATKAVLHQFILCLRKQLRNSKIKEVELYPPAVQTKLHDEKHQPDLKDGRSIGMPLDESMDLAYSGLESGLEQVAISMAKEAFDSFETKRQELFARLMKSASGGA